MPTAIGGDRSHCLIQPTLPCPAADAVAHLSPSLHQILMDSQAELPFPESALLLPMGATSADPLPGGAFTLTRLPTRAGTIIGVTINGGRIRSKLNALVQVASSLPGGQAAHNLCMSWQVSELQQA